VTKGGLDGRIGATPIAKPEKTQEQLEWLGHSETKKLQQEIALRQQKLLLQIIQAAESSKDANVLKLAVQYRECEQQLRRFE